MKTKKLIELLQKEDPEGEMECCIGNADIHYVAAKPGYWDGCLQILKRDETSKYYNVIGAEYKSGTQKLEIKSLSIADAIFNNENLPVTYDGKYAEEHYKEYVENCRKQAVEIKDDCERGSFIQYLKKRLADQWDDIDDDMITKTGNAYYNANMSHDDEMPNEIACITTERNYGTEEEPSIYKVIPSWNERREMQWDKELNIEFNNGDLRIVKQSE